jgi:ribosomal 50S subunit-associated protein YjgA (DUF615 family)
MSYPTYEDARARERELLRSAQKHKVSSVPRQERRSIFQVHSVLASIRERYVAVTRRATRHAKRPAPARA